MAALHGLSEFVLLPVLAAVYLGRTVWTAVLALLAGFGMVQARCDKPGTTSDPTKPDPVVLCYEQAAPDYFAENMWNSSATMRNWASAEREILSYARSSSADFSVLEGKIKYADQAYQIAKRNVDSGILRRDVYQAAGEILGEWHRDIALSSTNVECYAKVSVAPMVAAVNQQLFTLNQLVKEGKLSASASDEAQAAIKQSMGQSLSPEAADELSRLLIQLLSFK